MWASPSRRGPAATPTRLRRWRRAASRPNSAPISKRGSPMDENKDLELEIKGLIIEALALEGMTPDEIAADQPLFGEGLGLDSIDALEIAMAIEERFGVVADDDPDANRQRFASVRNLANFVAQSRA